MFGPLFSLGAGPNHTSGVNVTQVTLRNHFDTLIFRARRMYPFHGNSRGYDSCVLIGGYKMVGAGGLVASIIAFAVGAILDYAVTVSSDQHGFNVNKVGVILMIVGVVGVVLSLIAMIVSNTRRRRTVVDDGQGNVVRRVDSTY